MPTQSHFEYLISRLETIRRDMVLFEEKNHELLSEVHERHLRSAANLLHYTSLRRNDLRETQRELAAIGLSSLGRCERWTLGNIDAVIHALYALNGTAEPDRGPGTLLTMDQGRGLIETNARDLLGLAPERIVRIMVTMPAEAADDYDLMLGLMKAGMNIIRINCAHDGEEVWARMIENRARACRELNRECGVYMDLAGPNPRTRISGGEIKGRRFNAGDRFILSREESETAGSSSDIPRIFCSHPTVIDDLKVGDRLLINDGKIKSVVEEKSEDEVLLRVTMSASEKGKKLKAEKGINLPDTDLSFPSLTEVDLAALPFIAKHADMVGYSFVRSVGDVYRLQEELAKHGSDGPGIVLKIETVSAFRNLPRLLLAAMKNRRVGVMIARGDLAVEAGFERLSEVQEEILWFCEAAHVPVIWATQVLETFVKTGLPGRGEITDAAMSGRAECVMLNKGPHIVEGVETLNDILLRMRAHQDKKRSIFRPLSVSTAFEANEPLPMI